MISGPFFLPEIPAPRGVPADRLADAVAPLDLEIGVFPAISAPEPSLEHIDAIRTALSDQVPEPFVLHGRMSKKQRAALIAALDALPPDAPRVLLATGKLVGEGFDHAPLDTLILTLPISWTGTLQQYAGRLHRDHANKTDILIYDYVELDHPQLYRMWEKRQRGYRAMGYQVDADQQQFRLGSL